MSATLRLFSSEDVHAALDFTALVEALRTQFSSEATAPVRSSHAVTPAGDRLLLMPAWDGVSLGVKIVTVFPGNPARGVPSVAALYVLMDGVTGHPVALVDGEALTLRRTGAASALASSMLSRKDASHLVLVGTGALAPYMAEAHCAVRPIERISVWGRTPAHVQRTVDTLIAQGLPARAASSLQGALADADIVTCATTAREPLVRGADVRDGTHVDLVGAFTPEMRESDDALVARASLFVDTFAGALKEGGDLVQPMSRGVIARESIRAELADLVTGAHPGRRTRDEVTLFKSVGTGVEDLCAARLVAQRLLRIS
jgi:alanine dehydrogenase